MSGVGQVVPKMTRRAVGRGSAPTKGFSPIQVYLDPTDKRDTRVTVSHTRPATGGRPTVTNGTIIIERFCNLILLLAIVSIVLTRVIARQELSYCNCAHARQSSPTSSPS
jgi:hypothetical protein